MPLRDQHWLPAVEQFDLPLNDTSRRIDSQVAWFGGALLFFITGLVMALLTPIDSLPGIDLPATVQTRELHISALAALGCTGLATYCGIRKVPAMPWLHLQILTATLLIAFAVASTGNAAPNLLSFYLLPVLMAAFLLPLAQSVPHIGLALGLVLTTGLGQDGVPLATAQSLTVALFILVVSGVLAFARVQLETGLRRNVELAGQDPLTGVANMRRFNHVLQAEIRRARRQGTSVTIFMIDLDDFKRVNDEFSHSLGDATLIACARAMQDEIRSDEMIARRGGDEFAVITVHESGKDPAALADRLKTVIRSERRALCPRLSIEGSIGFATWRQLDLPEDIVARADRALRAAKRLARAEDRASEPASATRDR